MITEDVERYFHFLSSRLKINSSAYTSPFFELNTSRTPKLVQAILCNEIEQATPIGLSVKIKFFLILVIGTLRFTFKWIFIAVLVKIFYKNRLLDIKALQGSDVILVGFVAMRNGSLEAKDFDGFSERFDKNAKISTIGLRLPSIPISKYLAGNERVIPLLSYVRFPVIFKCLLKQFVSGVNLLKNFDLPLSLQEVCAEDWTRGHSCGSYILGDAIEFMVMLSRPTAVIYFPLERHDWEQVAITRIKGSRRIECVQNCTFSPMDLNMYLNFRCAPGYRGTQPDRLHVINKQWASVFRESLGFSCPIDVMDKHRFSDASMRINLDGLKKRILVISGINKQKLDLDLRALLPIANCYEIEVRIHPSILNYPLPPTFKSASINLEQRYGWCVYADTSMVFQLVCDRRYLLYIDHEGIPNQNPAQWFDDFGSANIKAANLLSKFPI